MTGVFLHSIFEISLIFVLFILFFGIAGTLFFKYIYDLRWPFIISFFVLFLALGFLRFHIKEQSLKDVFSGFIGRQVEYTGKIISDPNQKEKSQSFVVLFQKDNIKTKILVNTNFSQSFFYGDMVHVEGILTYPENFLTNAGKNFDYISYLKKDGILYTMKSPEIEIISKDENFSVKKYLFLFKNNFLSKLEKVVAMPERALLSGLLLGERAEIPKDLQEDFIKTGTIHIVALSGYNITIIATWLISIFLFLFSIFGFVKKREYAFICGILGIILFVIMTGAEATAVRSGIMAGLMLLGKILSRERDILRIMLITAFVMILVNPFVLYFDVSFQLSFIATIAVIFLTPRVEKYFLFLPNIFSLREIITTTFSAYIFVLPFVVYVMGTFSIVALLANTLILPLIPLTMLFGFMTGALGFLSYFISAPFGIITYKLLNLEIYLAKYLASLPFSHFYISHLPLIFVILIYAYFIYFLFGKGIKAYFVVDSDLASYRIDKSA